MSALAKNLERILRERGLAPTTTSRKAGLAHTTIGDIIEGKTQHPRFPTIKKIADVLEVSPFDLTKDGGHPQIMDISQHDEKTYSTLELALELERLPDEDRQIVAALIRHLRKKSEEA